MGARVTFVIRRRPMGLSDEESSAHVRPSQRHQPVARCLFSRPKRRREVGDRAGRIGERWTSSGGRGKHGHTAIVKVQVIDMSSKSSRLDAITHLPKGPSHV
jgi:hypothetical protein